MNIDCLYSDGIDSNETVRLYLFDKYDSDDFEDTRHKDVVRIMVEQPKTKKITIDEIKQNLTYVIQNNVILPNKVEILYSYKELAISQSKSDITKLMKNLKNIYNYTCIYSVPDSHQLKHMIFNTNQDEWDEFYNDAKVTSQALEIDKRKLDKIFVFVVNSSGSNSSLRLNEKYGTLFYNFSELKEKIPVIDANIKNINKVLLNKFNDYWGNAKNSSNIFSLKFEGQNSGVYVLTIKKLDDLIKGVKFEQSVEKEIDDKEEKEKAQLEAQDKEDEKIDALLDSQEKDLEKEADKTKKILESEEGDENAERENSKKDEDEAEKLADESLAVKIDKEKNEAKKEVGEAENKKTKLMGSVKEGFEEEEKGEINAAKAKAGEILAEKEIKQTEKEAKSKGKEYVKKIQTLNVKLKNKYKNPSFEQYVNVWIRTDSVDGGFNKKWMYGDELSDKKVLPGAIYITEKGKEAFETFVDVFKKLNDNLKNQYEPNTKTYKKNWKKRIERGLREDINRGPKSENPWWLGNKNEIFITKAGEGSFKAFAKEEKKAKEAKVAKEADEKKAKEAKEAEDKFMKPKVKKLVDFLEIGELQALKKKHWKERDKPMTDNQIIRAAKREKFKDIETLKKDLFIQKQLKKILNENKLPEELKIAVNAEDRLNIITAKVKELNEKYKKLWAEAKQQNENKVLVLLDTNTEADFINGGKRRKKKQTKKQTKKKQIKKKKQTKKKAKK